MTIKTIWISQIFELKMFIIKDKVKNDSPSFNFNF